MNILLLGGGGREHALAWKLAQSPRCSALYAAPGNPGIAQVARLVDLDLADHSAVIAFCDAIDIGLVVVGPEAPLVDGIADSLRDDGISVFGPGKAAAQLEGSKGYTKDLCVEADIPTARYVRCASETEARTALPDFGLPVVIKADGLAAGKGVIIAQTAVEAEEAIADMFGGSFGMSGAEVVIEAFMTGEEASFFALSDGVTVVPFGSAQDHKRVGDGDTGPNTGGMGAYSPASVLTPALEARVMDEIVRPTVAAMAARGTPYSGVLFAGLMLTPQGPQLIEYNCRFGDPECQVLMMRFEGDLVELLLATADGRLTQTTVPAFSDRVALTVVLAANGYPETPEKGSPISLPIAPDDNMIFHAGTALKDGALVSNGGRVLCATARGASVSQAQAAAYMLVDKIGFPGGFCRRDIGWREVEREAASARHAVTRDLSEAFTDRLRADLKTAMQARARTEAAVLRSLIGAVDNAQSVPLDHMRKASHVGTFGDPSLEVPRKSLGENELQQILQKEIAEREAAAEEMTRVGRSDRAEMLRAETAIVSRYLSAG